MIYPSEAEKAVLSTVLFTPSILSEMIGYLTAEDFYNPNNQTIFSEMLNMSTEGVGISMPILADRLPKLVEYIGELASSLPDPKNVMHFADSVNNASRQRMLSGLLESVSNVSDVDHVLSALKYGMQGIQEKSPSKDFYHISELEEEFDEMMEKYSRCELTGFKTGQPYLDALFMGIQSGFYVIAGRPHMGKSHFAMQLTIWLAETGTRVWFHSLELTRGQLVAKLAAVIGGYTLFDLKSGRVSKSKVEAAKKKLFKLPITIRDKKYSVNQVESMLYRNRDKYDVVFIDQLSHIKHTSGSRFEAFSNSVNGLNSIQKDLQIPMFLLAQIGRGIENSENKRPSLSNLKETGALEEDADVAMLLYRDEYYNKDTAAKGVLEVDVCKNRVSEHYITLEFRSEGAALHSVVSNPDPVIEGILESQRTIKNSKSIPF